MYKETCSKYEELYSHLGKWTGKIADFLDGKLFME